MIAPLLLLLAAPLVSDEPTTATAPPPPFTLNGYAEGYYQWSVNTPSNNITAFRGYDNRHNSLTLQNAQVQASWDVENVVGVVALQFGAVPAVEYAGEPALAGGGGAGASSAALLQNVQQANAGYRFPVLGGLLVQGGIFLSPIGPEGIAVKDNWNWSRSDLFFALPSYHAGLRGALNLDETWSVTALLTNGWNDVVDNNDGKSFALAVSYALPNAVSAQALYFGGPERAQGAPEGDGAWRHLFDLSGTVTPTPWLGLQGQLDAGLENNSFGASDWYGAAVTARFQALPVLWLAARGDVLHEDAASNAKGTASHLFMPGHTLGSGTATVDARPVDNVSFRLEYRHDQADAPTYFRGKVGGDGLVAPFALDANSQDTVTAGVVAWF